MFFAMTIHNWVVKLYGHEKKSIRFNWVLGLSIQWLGPKLKRTGPKRFRLNLNAPELKKTFSDQK